MLFFSLTILLSIKFLTAAVISFLFCYYLFIFISHSIVLVFPICSIHDNVVNFKKFITHAHCRRTRVSDYTMILKRAFSVSRYHRSSEVGTFVVDYCTFFFHLFYAFFWGEGHTFLHYYEYLLSTK